MNRETKLNGEIAALEIRRAEVQRKSASAVVDGDQKEVSKLREDLKNTNTEILEKQNALPEARKRDEQDRLHAQTEAGLASAKEVLKHAAARSKAAAKADAALESLRAALLEMSETGDRMRGHSRAMITNLGGSSEDYSAKLPAVIAHRALVDTVPAFDAPFLGREANEIRATLAPASFAEWASYSEAAVAALLEGHEAA